MSFRAIVHGVALSMLCLTMATSEAQIEQGMRNVFNNLGAYGQVNGPSYIAAQSRHVFAGGGLTYRAPRQTYQLLSATGPSLRAGCGGIDLYAGSFSFINKDQFVQMLNNIAANSIGLAFKTALCSTSANLCQAIEDLQRTIQGLNRFNIDSCEAAKRVVGGFMGSAAQVSQSACQASGWVAGLASDASDARAQCAQPAQFARSRAAAATGSEAEQQPVEFVGGNLTWQILADAGSGLGVVEREFLQSMLGTHVVATVSLSLQHFPPTITSVTDLNEHEIMLLKCRDTSACLDVQATEVTLATSFIELAQNRLADMRTRLAAGTTLTDAQVNLVASAPVPVLALLQADVAGASGLADIAAEAIAYSAAHHFLTNTLRQAASGASAWRSRSVNEAELARALVIDSRALRNELAREMHVATARVNELLSVSAQVRELRAKMAGDLLGPVGHP